MAERSGKDAAAHQHQQQHLQQQVAVNARQTAGESNKTRESLSKKATLIFLASLGVTLLVTGATGTRLLKKRTTAPSSGTAPSSSAVLRTLAASSSSSKPRSSSKLRDLFVTSQAGSTSLDFVSNQYTASTTSLGSGLTRELPLPPATAIPSSPGRAPVSNLSATTSQQRQSGDGNGAQARSDPMMDALVDAVKAFTIATVLVIGGSTGIVGGLAWKFGSDDVDSFLSTLKHSYIAPFSDNYLAPLMPGYVKEKINKYLCNPNDIEEIRQDEKALEDWFGEDASTPDAQRAGS